MESTPRGQRNAALAKAGTLLGALALGLVLGEAICRWLEVPYHHEWTPTENALARFDPDLGWAFVPGRSLVQRFDGRPVAFHADANGIRVPWPGHALDPAKPTILFIGCSFTMGYGLSWEESFVGRLAAREDMPYQVVNLGVPAYGSDQALIALERFLSRFDTRVVVYTFLPVHIARNGNADRRIWFPTAKFLGTKPRYGLDGDGRLVLRERPRRYEETARSWLLDLVRVELTRRFGPPYPIELTREIIREMKRTVEAHAAAFVLLDWDWEFHDVESERQKAIRVEDVFAGLELDLIRVSEHAPAGWKQMRLKRSGHPNAALSEHVAGALWEHLRTHGHLEP
jgi:hypothetical protein